MSTRRTDPPSLEAPERREDRLEELLEHGSRNFRRYRRRALTGYWLLVTFSVLGFAVGFHKIDDSRRDTLIRACQESNRRHDATIAKLDALVAAIPDRRRRLRAERSKRGTIALIEALAPKTNCTARADRLVKPVK